MKRILSLTLVALMFICCILTACGGDGDGVESEMTSSSTSSAVSEESASSVTESEGESETDIVESSEVIESSEESKEDESVEESSTPNESTPEDDTPEVKNVEVLFTRYTQASYYVMIGTCTQGASVTASEGSQSVTVDSYMGWFEVTLQNVNYAQSLNVSFSQTLDGSEIASEQSIAVTPINPPNKGTRALGSNYAFQFFLEKMVPDFTGGNLYPDSVIESMKTRVSDRIKMMNEYTRGAEIIYMIVPSPMTTYPELAPDYLKQGTGTTRLDQVTKGLTDAGATVIDLRETFNEHKYDEMPLYYKLDSHWADYGAYLAYVELFNHISKTFKQATPRDIDDFKWTADYYVSADACLYLDIPQTEVYEYGYYREFDFEDPANITSIPRYRGMQLIYNDLTTIEKTFSTGNYAYPNCIVYRDSYCAGIYDLIPERMNNTHYIGMWNYAWQNSLIQNERPNYVIYIIAEWNMNEVVYN